ncbi:50S ribosomal protein L22 [Patescibacteria group bacterium]|nr:50S ribosomal protein L22 [Patescibacteria group bacterium]MBU4367883.1 50S ribosomal protein L22 [Patescibacteria group bacterium]MBU4461940.1 50S ribosomal protein L22 [Patescibacteria group bacterium]MCG2699883.1 50S ribosomal protein L22 [Candidatus Parcubacteria bacterium]
MEIKVELNYLRITPRKTRQAVNLVRGKKVEEAEALLEFSANRPAKSVLKLLRSAVTSAKNSFQLEPSNLYISKIFVDEGPKLKRWMPVSRGSAHPLWKRASHITLVLAEVKPTSKKKTKKKTEEKIKKEEPTKIEEAKISEEKTESQPKKEKPTQPKFKIEESKKQGSLRGLKRIFRRKAF